MTEISHIKLELAREPGHPEGSSEHGYDLHLPIDADGRIDAAAWRRQKKLCRVRKFSPGAEDRRGLILHGPGGRWLFDYTDETVRDDEHAFNFQEERFVVGEYVSIRENDGVMHTFKVVAVRPE